MADTRRKLVIASGNAGKLGEYRALLDSTGLELIAYDHQVDETGSTYAENARLKATAASTASGLPALGDDSGLEVDVLDGFPGIRSARLGPTQQERTALARWLYRRFSSGFISPNVLPVPGTRKIGS